MNKREVLKAVQADVKAGKDRRQVFEAYKPHIAKPLHLATMIASVADEKAKQENRGLNLALVVLLAVTGLLKAVGVFATLSGNNLILAGALALLSMGIPFLFAFEINRFNGQVYGLLTILAGLGIVNTLLRIGEDVIGALIGTALLGGILALSLVLRQKLFPALRVLGVKTDGSGNYLLG